MIRHLRTISAVGVTVAVGVLLGSAAFAEPFIGAPIHAPYPVQPITIPPTNGGVKPTGNSSNTSGTSNTSSTSITPTTPIKPPVKPITGASNTSGSDTSQTTTSAEVKQQLQAAQIKLCNERSSTISIIMTRADVRAQNQVNLFTNIATKVEAFYTSKGKTVSNYDQLVAAVNAAATQANSDLIILQTNSMFSCGGNNPAGTISTYRTELNTVQTDSQSLRTAVKNLIVGVAKAEGYTLPSSSPSPGGQQ